MATIQARKSRGKKYWYIVESRRVNGKPRPITLAYLGKADALLKRLQGLTEGIKLKSYSHGAVAAILKIAEALNICKIINEHANSIRTNRAKKPIRNNLTVGATLLLAAIGRICKPTSKASWSEWAKTTSIPYLLKMSLSKIDSQHFWDMMDTIPESAIEKMEETIIKAVLRQYKIDTNTLCYDTTNFYTYIHTTNHRCQLAKRGRNKQKRKDLRQIGLALAVSKKEKIPLFHLTYEGNRHDAKIFSRIIGAIKIRLESVGLSPNHHTLIFDRGNNSKENLQLLTANKFHYVGALVPYQHKNIVTKALAYFAENEHTTVYRNKQLIWEEERTIVVFISSKLKASQLHWLYTTIEKIESKLQQLQQSVAKRKQPIDTIQLKIDTIIKKYESYVDYRIKKTHQKIRIHYSINQTKVKIAEEKCGLRMIMTDRHHWSDEDIIHTYQGQSQIEHAFRDMKNPSCLAVRPQYHWTDQKIKVHFFICVLGYLLASILKQKVDTIVDEPHDISTIIQKLNNIRLATILEDTNTPGKMKAHYKLEALDNDETKLVNALLLQDIHLKRPKLNGFSVYN